jgi:alanyl-tRNA synthetase
VEFLFSKLEDVEMKDILHIASEIVKKIEDVPVLLVGVREKGAYIVIGFSDKSRHAAEKLRNSVEEKLGIRMKERYNVFVAGMQRSVVEEKLNF